MTQALRRRTAALSFPLALLTALALLLVSELAYNRSMAALQDTTHAFQVRLDISRLLRLMVDAESGQRGYLLTGKANYLEPYAAATGQIGSVLGRLTSYYRTQPGQLEDFETLARAMEKKISELDLSLKMRREGRDEAWQALLETDIGREAQETIRAAAERLGRVESERLQAHQAQVTRTLLISRLGVGSMTVLSLLAFYLYLRQARELVAERERKRLALQAERDALDGQVQRRTAQLTELMQHLQTMQETERSHLARELHDELGALLTSAKLDVARLKSRLPDRAPEVIERLDHLSEVLNNGIALKRRIIEDLRPSALGHLGLVASLEILTREFGQRSGLAMHTELQAVPLGESADLTVYRFVQEALTNIARHAQAKRVDVLLRSVDGGIDVSVHDDGAGFDPQAVRSNAHGLVGMRYRVRPKAVACRCSRSRAREAASRHGCRCVRRPRLGRWQARSLERLRRRMTRPARRRLERREIRSLPPHSGRFAGLLPTHQKNGHRTFAQHKLRVAAESAASQPADPTPTVRLMPVATPSPWLALS